MSAPRWSARVWVQAVTDHRCGDGRRLLARARLVALALALYADHGTGRNARPSQVTLARLTGLKRDRVRLALRELVEAGFLVECSRDTLGTVTYALTYADQPGPEQGPGTEPADLAQSRAQPGPEQGTNLAQSRDHNLPHLPTVGREEEEGSGDGRATRAAPSPQAAAAAAAAVAAITTAWPKVKALQYDTGALAPIVAELIERGWTAEHLAAHAATAPRPQRNPTRLLAAHLARLLDVDPATVHLAPTRPTGMPPEAAAVWDALAAAGFGGPSGGPPVFDDFTDDPEEDIDWQVYGYDGTDDDAIGVDVYSDGGVNIQWTADSWHTGPSAIPADVWAAHVDPAEKAAEKEIRRHAAALSAAVEYDEFDCRWRLKVERRDLIPRRLPDLIELARAVRAVAEPYLPPLPTEATA